MWKNIKSRLTFFFKKLFSTIVCGLGEWFWCQQCKIISTTCSLKSLVDQYGLGKNKQEGMKTSFWLEAVVSGGQIYYVCTKYGFLFLVLNFDFTQFVYIIESLWHKHTHLEYFHSWNIFQNIDWASSLNPFFLAEKFCLNLWFRILIHLCHLTFKFFLYPVKSIWIYFVSQPAFLYSLLFWSVYVSNTSELMKNQNYI